jgi:hypothetical protein
MTITIQDQILSEFDAWAVRRRRPADVQLLAAVLTSRLEQLGRSPTLWEAGDVQLALACTVAKRPELLLQVAELEQTLESYFRFLRNTGRLASGSADPRTLRKEVRRGARAFAELLKVFAVAVEDEEDDEDDLDLDLLHPEDPQHERLWLLRELGVRRGDLRLRWWAPLPPIERAAAQGMATAYLRRVTWIGELVAPSMELEDVYLPGADEAWRIASALDLTREIRSEWSRSGHEPPELTPAMVRRSDAFRDLWLRAFVTDVIRIEDGVARPGSQPARAAGGPASHQLIFATKVGRGRLENVCDREDEHGLIVVELLVRSLLRRRSWWSFDEARTSVARLLGPEWAVENEEEIRAALRRSVDALAEAGVVEEADGQVRLTEFGAWVVDDWIDAQFEDW